MRLYSPPTPRYHLDTRLAVCDSCHINGSLTLILLPISRHTQNILHHPSHSASISVSSDPPAAARARVALMGAITVLDDAAAVDLKECYLAQHPDAQEWLPGDEDGAHVAYWARFDPQVRRLMQHGRQGNFDSEL